MERGILIKMMASSWIYNDLVTDLTDCVKFTIDGLVRGLVEVSHHLPRLIFCAMVNKGRERVDDTS